MWLGDLEGSWRGNTPYLSIQWCRIRAVRPGWSLWVYNCPPSPWQLPGRWLLHHTIRVSTHTPLHTHQHVHVCIPNVHLCISLLASNIILFIYACRYRKIVGDDCTEQPNSTFLFNTIPCPPVVPGGLAVTIQDTDGLTAGQPVTFVLTQQTVINIPWSRHYFAYLQWQILAFLMCIIFYVWFWAKLSMSAQVHAKIFFLKKHKK